MGRRIYLNDIEITKTFVGKQLWKHEYYIVYDFTMRKLGIVGKDRGNLLKLNTLQPEVKEFFRRKYYEEIVDTIKKASEIFTDREWEMLNDSIEIYHKDRTIKNMMYDIADKYILQQSERKALTKKFLDFKEDVEFDHGCVIRRHDLLEKRR